MDAAGHVVGKNIETITLPYAYKTFKTDKGVSEVETDIFEDDVIIESLEETSTTADNTQDILTINPFNKWI